MYENSTSSILGALFIFRNLRELFVLLAYAKSFKCIWKRDGYTFFKLKISKLVCKCLVVSAYVANGRFLEIVRL